MLYIKWWKQNIISNSDNMSSTGETTPGRTGICIKYQIWSTVDMICFLLVFRPRIVKWQMPPHQENISEYFPLCMKCSDIFLCPEDTLEPGVLQDDSHRSPSPAACWGGPPCSCTSPCPAPGCWSGWGWRPRAPSCCEAPPWRSCSGWWRGPGSRWSSVWGSCRT